MNQITQEDLLRYSYGETSEHKTALIEEALKKDFKLKESYEQLKAMQQSLDSLKSSPSDEVMQRIFKYAASKQGKVQAH